jgi:hypothetical protein
MRFDQAVHDVGAPTPEFTTKWLTTERTTKIICVHEFASLSTELGVDSPEFEGFGNQWCLTIYPGGVEMTQPKEWCQSNSKICQTKPLILNSVLVSLMAVENK